MMPDLYLIITPDLTFFIIALLYEWLLLNCTERQYCNCKWNPFSFVFSYSLPSLLFYFFFLMLYTIIIMWFKNSCLWTLWMILLGSIRRRNTQTTFFFSKALIPGSNHDINSFLFDCAFAFGSISIETEWELYHH